MDCYSQDTLADMIRGVSDPETAVRHEAHLRECATCRHLLAQVREEVLHMRASIRALGDPDDAPCPEEEVLALYLDGALSEERKPDLESHVATCASCRENLAAMYGALRYVLEPEDTALASPSRLGAVNGTKGDLGRFWRFAK